MCVCGLIPTHLAALVLEVAFAAPSLALWKDASDYGPDGPDFFFFVVGVAVAGLVFVCVRKCCASVLAVRWAANFILGAYMLCQLFIAGTAIYYAYVFFYPLSGGRARKSYEEYYGKLADAGTNFSYTAFVTVYALAGVCSVLLSVLALLLTCHAWKVAEIPEDIAARERAGQDEAEREHFLSKKSSDVENSENPYAAYAPVRT